jgi:hypothetical protein
LATGWPGGTGVASAELIEFDGHADGPNLHGVTEPGVNHSGEVGQHPSVAALAAGRQLMPVAVEARGTELRPAVAARALGVEPVAVLEQTGEGAEVDHARA